MRVARMQHLPLPPSRCAGLPRRARRPGLAARSGHDAISRRVTDAEPPARRSPGRRRSRRWPPVARARAPPAQGVTPRPGPRWGCGWGWPGGRRAPGLGTAHDRAVQSANAPHSAEHHLLAGAAGTALPPLLTANTAPDVVLSGGQNRGVFVEGGTVELGGFVKRDKLDLGKWYLPLEGEGYVRAGKHYGMPFYVAHGIYLVNKTLFATHNVPLPNDAWTWNDLHDAARRLTQPGTASGCTPRPASSSAGSTSCARPARTTSTRSAPARRSTRRARSPSSSGSSTSSSETRCSSPSATPAWGPTT